MSPRFVVMLRSGLAPIASPAGRAYLVVDRVTDTIVRTAETRDEASDIADALEAGSDD